LVAIVKFQWFFILYWIILLIILWFTIKNKEKIKI
jgi:hypothetical protein